MLENWVWNKVSEYNQEMSQLQIADQYTTSWGKETEYKKPKKQPILSLDKMIAKLDRTPCAKPQNKKK